jgi:hypothetical protein
MFCSCFYLPTVSPSLSSYFICLLRRVFCPWISDDLVMADLGIMVLPGFSEDWDTLGLVIPICYYIPCFPFIAFIVTFEVMYFSLECKVHEDKDHLSCSSLFITIFLAPNIKYSLALSSATILLLSVQQTFVKDLLKAGHCAFQKNWKLGSSPRDSVWVDVGYGQDINFFKALAVIGICIQAW